MFRRGLGLSVYCLEGGWASEASTAGVLPGFLVPSLWLRISIGLHPEADCGRLLHEE